MNKQTVTGDDLYILIFILNLTKMHTQIEGDERKR